MGGGEGGAWRGPCAFGATASPAWVDVVGVGWADGDAEDPAKASPIALQGDGCGTLGSFLLTTIAMLPRAPAAPRCRFLSQAPVSRVAAREVSLVHKSCSKLPLPTTPPVRSRTVVQFSECRQAPTRWAPNAFLAQGASPCARASLAFSHRALRAALAAALALAPSTRRAPAYCLPLRHSLSRRPRPRAGTGHRLESSYGTVVMLALW